MKSALDKTDLSASTVSSCVLMRGVANCAVLDEIFGRFLGWKSLNMRDDRDGYTVNASVHVRSYKTRLISKLK